MNDYFDEIEQSLAAIVRRRRHLPWYLRLRSMVATRPVLALLAVLVVATPAVAAATNWFGIGQPDRLPAGSPTQFIGRALPGTGQLLAMRVADPQGGPPWALRMVRTTRGDVCLQLGRAEHSRLGSLGVDDAWHDDHLFHPFPNTAVGDVCGTTDARGHGFVNTAETGVVASANPIFGAERPEGAGCRAAPTGPSQRPLCPKGSLRIVFMGLLGPDATSITYQRPDGAMASERTSGPDGAYLLVFRDDTAACRLVIDGQFSSGSSCNVEQYRSGAGTSPGPASAVKAISYRDGHTCHLMMPAGLYRAYRALTAQIQRQDDSPATARRLIAQLGHRHHLPPGWQLKYMTGTICPPVGYQAQTAKQITAAEVATHINVKTITGTRWCSRRGRYRPNVFDWIACDHAVPAGYQRISMISNQTHTPGVLADMSLTARQPVTSSRSSYNFFIQNPSGCGSSGSGGKLGFGNIHVGQKLRFQDFEDYRCKGTYQGVVSYTQNAGPAGPQAGVPSLAGQHGSINVGHFHFSVQ